MSTSVLLPAIRSRIGDWSYYITALSLKNVGQLIKSPDEIHDRKKLSDWIQREAIESHAEAIATYIKDNDQRFLGSLIIGVYDGNPNWAPLNINFVESSVDINEDQKKSIEGKLGLLHLSGEEKLFAIDGQHRVAGIKKVLQNVEVADNISDDEVSAIFVAHDESSLEGKQRTRRLFTTVNKKAKRISTAAIIALDEDNGFAIVTRDLIDKHWLFEDEREHLSYTSTGAIVATDETIITSVVGLHEIIKDIYGSRGRKKFESERPSDSSMEKHLGFCMEYFNNLLDKCYEYKSVFVDLEQKACIYREGEKNHLLFRPIGQRAFARATQVLVQQGKTLPEAVKSLLAANLYINSEDWYGILWDPVENKMITKKLVIAETQLLILSGNEAKNLQNKRKLDEFIAARDA